MKQFQQAMALVLSWCLLFAGARGVFAQAADTPAWQQLPQAAQQSPEQLEQLVAPIALYPDAMITHILAGATFPDQIGEAGKRVEKRKGVREAQLVE